MDFVEVVESFQFVLGILIWFLCPVLLLLILLQGGSGDLSSTFGGGGRLDASLGVGAQAKMSKITTWLAVVFLLTVLILAIDTGRGLATESGTDYGDDAPQMLPGDEEPTEGVGAGELDEDESAADAPTITPPPPGAPEAGVDETGDANDAEPDAAQPEAGADEAAEAADEDDADDADDTDDTPAE